MESARIIKPFEFVAQPDFLGGDGRYLFVLNRVDQTVTIVDCATHTVHSTVTLTAARAFATICYRSVSQQVYVFGNGLVDIIDANPSSAGFGTKSSITFASNPEYPFGVVYSSQLDRFYANNMMFRPDGVVEVGFSRIPSACQLLAYFPSIDYLNLWVSGNSVTSNQFAIGLARRNYRPIWDLNTNIRLLKIGDFVWTTAKKINVKSGDIEASFGGGISTPSDSCYDPVNRVRYVAGLDNSVTLRALNLSALTTQTETRAAGLDTNETATRDLLYNPYNGFVYAKASAAGVSRASGVGRVHYFNTNGTPGSRYVNFVAVGQDGSTLGGTYALDTMCLNRLRQFDYAA